PVLNGLQVFQRLKTLSPEIKTIFLSDYHVPSEFLGFLPGVAHEDVIVRPITEDTFVPVLLNKIRTHRNALVLSNNRLLPVSSNNLEMGVPEFWNHILQIGSRDPDIVGNSDRLVSAQENALSYNRRSDSCITGNPFVDTVHHT
ncbi:MAG: hypothetical protein ACRD5H_12130, partial [Nitrososphaerales archaeon]